MAAVPTMDHHDRRLSVCKSSSSKISKPSSAPRPPSAASSRPPPTLVSADLNNFRRVVQQLTGTPPRPSASSSPVHESTRSSRLQRIAPPPLRPLLHKQHQQNQQPLNQYGQQHQQVSNLPPLQQPHHDHYMRHNIRVQDNDQPSQHDFSWLSSILSPPLSNYTQVANLNQNPDSDFNACINPLLLSPYHFAPTASDSMWANPLHATPSPRPLSNSAGSLPPLLPWPSVSGEDQSGSEAFEWPALSVTSSQLSATNGHSLRLPSSKGLLSSSNGQPLLPSSANGRPLLGSLSNGNPLHSSSSSSNEQSLLGPSPKGYPLLPSPHAALPPLLPLSPSTTFSNPWFPPWASSPFLPLPFSPGLSPGLSPFISSPRGFSFSGTNDYQSKLP